MSQRESDNQPEVHQGHDPETGVLARLRDWTDLFGWLRLARVLRIAASPLMILLATIPLTFWLATITSLSPQAIEGTPLELRANDAPTATDTSSASSTSVVPAILGVPNSTFTLVESVNPSAWLARSSRDGSQVFYGLVAVLASAVLWTPVILILTRQGALLTAGREMEPLRPLAKRCLKRTPAAMLIPVVPFLCGCVLAVPGLLLAWLISLMDSFWVIQIPIATLLLVLTIPVGLLLFGSLFAGPLGYAAIANESTPDPLDSLSRGYESLLRRPAHLFGYLIVAVVLMFCVWVITSGVAIFAVHVLDVLFHIVGASNSTTAPIVAAVGFFPLLVNVVLFWAAIGGVYLLSRESTCQQQVEDLWIPEPQIPDPQIPDPNAAASPT